MNYISFNDWLIETKDMSKRSAKDVISRCRRVCKILNIDKIPDNTLTQLSESKEFGDNSMFIKSQLKRAVSLWLEYGGK